MKPENRPSVLLSLVVVDRGPDRGSVCRLRMQTRTMEEVTLRTWEWPTGRPTSSQLEDLAADLSAEVTATIMTTRGVQGVL